MRSDMKWERRLPKPRLDSAGQPVERPPRREELRNHELVNAVEGMRARRGRVWGPTDAATIRELHIRAKGYSEAKRARTYQVPQWLPMAIQEALGTLRRGWGVVVFLSILVDAYRQGAVGVVLSYEEAMALCGVRSRDTWRRWTGELEAGGLIRCVQTWAEDTTCTGRPRRCDRLYYRIGPSLEAAAGFGILEGAPGLGDKHSAWAARAAQGARKRSADAVDDRKAELWELARRSEGRPGVAPTSPWGQRRRLEVAGGAEEAVTESPPTVPESPGAERARSEGPSEPPRLPKTGSSTPLAPFPSSTINGPHPACPSGREAEPEAPDFLAGRATRGPYRAPVQLAPAPLPAHAATPPPPNGQSRDPARCPEGRSAARATVVPGSVTPSQRAQQPPGDAPPPLPGAPPVDAGAARRRILERKRSLDGFLSQIAGEGGRFADVARQLLTRKKPGDT